MNTRGSYNAYVGFIYVCMNLCVHIQKRYNIQHIYTYFHMHTAKIDECMSESFGIEMARQLR